MHNYYAILKAEIGLERVLIIVALIILIPSAVSFLAGFELWWCAIAAVILISLSSLGIWMLL
ncbi:hypothetical protein [Enteractinococcus helveticum]|uniref:Uncharacterized protein n=1 Tax=Enteractinococcus helveticum TaxID=1837282 RepID=A0A1B7LXR3_9MICC|nr:hypothetical protein [Enteractinococcus helveticum]OAV59976.1 hypothetical protein A6F49_14670 [Enteractinococcus helveticum]